MQLTENQSTVIAEHVLSEYPKEAVFALTSSHELVILKNLHPDPTEFFSIDEQELDELDPIALIHSHTYHLSQLPENYIGHKVDLRMPSKMDMKAQMLLDIEFGIVSCDGTTVSEILWYPDLDAKIIGQEYLAGVNDCYSIIRRWYWQEKGILLRENARDYSWITEQPDKYADDYKDFGWVDVPMSDIQVGDMLIIRIGHHESHSGLYIGNGRFIHHMTGQLSREEDINKWLKRITRVTRQKDNLIK